MRIGVRTLSKSVNFDLVIPLIDVVTSFVFEKLNAADFRSHKITVQENIVTTNN